MEKYVSAEWLKKQIRVIGVTTGNNFEMLIDAAPSVNVESSRNEGDVNEDQTLKTLEYIRNGYQNLVENSAERFRLVGKEVEAECDVAVEGMSFADLYRNHVAAMDEAIKAYKEVKGYE